jgi:hypothetical protein
VMERSAQGSIGPEAEVRVMGKVFLGLPALLALLAVVGWPLAIAILAADFERRRWEESDHPWGERSGSAPEGEGGDDG